MRVRYLLALPLLASLFVSTHDPVLAQDAPEKKFPDFATFTKGAKEYDGLFKLYQKDEHVYLEIRQDQFDKPLLAPIAVARGMNLGGYTLNFDEQWVIIFKKVGDKVFLVRRNVHFKAKSDTPVALAVETSYNDSVLMALPIKTINPAKNAPLIDLNQIFFTDFAQLNLGSLDRERTVWGKIKAFPKNIELQVAATFTGGRGDSIIDSRGNTVVMHYGLVQMPEPGYTPRLADDRVGHFLTAVKDFSSDNKDTSYVRYINRWRLERADGSTWKEGGKLSAPKKKIVFWIEKSVPDEYRAAVREGILEWNKAYEKIGFRDAIEVRQQESEDFDPEDVNYNTFRWIATDEGFAMGPSRANPLTGELIDADIIFDASMVRFYKTEYNLFRQENGQILEAPISPIQSARMGWDLPKSPLALRGWNDRISQDPMEARMFAIKQGFCQCGSHKSNQLAMAMMTMLARADLKPGERVPEELVQQAIKEVTMHEVGHTLGLRHNFKASTMLKNEQLHDIAITRKQGLVGSVMDYSPVNIAPKGVKQGDYFTTTLGPYDYWVIDYAYRPLSGSTEGEFDELQKIATKAPMPGLDFGTDEDMMATSDPLINVWDLGSDTMKFAQDRIVLSEELFKGLADRVVEKGEGYQRARLAFSLLLRQYADASFLVASHIGGEFASRDHRGDDKARDPMVPVNPTKQRDALKFLGEHIFTDQPFVFPPELLRKLAADRWMHWGTEMSAMQNVEYPLNERILAVQLTALDHLMNGTVLMRVQNSASKVNKDEKPLEIAEIYRSLTDSVWSDLFVAADKAPTTKSSIIRRNLQREHLKRLASATLGKSRIPPDARSLARSHLKQISARIDLSLADKKTPLDDTARAHLEECKEQIAKVLSASLTAIE